MKNRVLMLAAALMLPACGAEFPTTPASETVQEEGSQLLQTAAETPEKQSDGGLRRDAEEYAKAFGVSIDEALRRLELQRAIGELDAKLEEQEADTFAGLYIEHEPEYRVVARFTRDGAATLQRYVADTALAGVVHAEQAHSTMNELLRAQEAALKAVRAQGLQVDGTLDVRENVAEVRVLGHAAAGAAQALRGLALPAQAKVTTVSKLMEPEVSGTIVGGATLRSFVSGGYYSCTGAFTVRNVNTGARGVLTAAHCRDDENVWDYTDNIWVQIRYQAGLHGGSHDVQWHTTPYVEDNMTWTGSNYREILGTKSRAYQTIGEWVCKYGITTGYTCGQINSKTYAPSYIPNANATFVQMYRAGITLSSPGDSGGPWFYGNNAYGVHSGGNGGEYSIYMPINYVGGLGLEVLVN